MRQQMGWAPAQRGTPKARAAALKAVALDETAAETHYALAVVRAWTDWDWAGAESEFKRAIDINPGFPDARIYYSHLLRNLQRLRKRWRRERERWNWTRSIPFSEVFSPGISSMLADMTTPSHRLARRCGPARPSPECLLCALGGIPSKA